MGKVMMQCSNNENIINSIIQIFREEGVGHKILFIMSYLPTVMVSAKPLKSYCLIFSLLLPDFWLVLI